MRKTELTASCARTLSTKEDMHLVRELLAERTARTGKAPVACTHAYGCQQNVSDGEKLDGMLAEMGYGFAPEPGAADLVLYNTCAVRENAEDRIYGNVGALKHAKARNPDMVIGLCGCMVQQAHVAEKLRKSFPYVDLVFGTHSLPLFPELLYRKLTEGGRVFSVEDRDGEIVEDLPLRREGSIKAWLPIMYGCNNFCTYCVVPLVRGRERSREPERILEEARGLVAEGFREITLLGQNVNSYGKTLGAPMSFGELLGRICAIPGEFRLRFMTSHPKDCTKELVDVIARERKICNHIHLPVQSGSDRILTAMNRGYTSGQYLELIRYAREKIPEASFTSDIIVGFPGETEEDFGETLRLVEAVGYHSLFTFQYSRREGTKAAAMEDGTSAEERSGRFQRLLRLQQAIGAEKYREMVGRRVEVLAEGPGRTGPGRLTGRTEANIIVEFAGGEELLGRFVRVEITEARNWALLGKAIDNE